MACIEIQGTPPKSYKKLAKSICKILSSKHTDESTKRLALKVLEAGVKQGNHSITNCNFPGGF